MIPLTRLNKGDVATIVRLDGGGEFQRKLRTTGIREGKTIAILTKQPFNGPIVVEIDGRGATLGRGMAQRIIVDVS